MWQFLGLALLIVLGVVAAAGLVFGWLMMLGWLIFIVYRAVAPETWITLNLWPCVGIAALLSLIFGGRSGAVTIKRD